MEDDFEEVKQPPQAVPNNQRVEMEEDILYERYLKEQQQIDSFETCKACNRHVTPEEQERQEITLLQSTDCFHMIHIKCFKDMIFKYI